MIITGEASGDLHGAGLIRAARLIDPELDFFGVGGSGMRAAGCEILQEGRELAVMGLVEVIGRFPVIYRSFKRLRQIMHERRPDVLVLIDFPDFNLRFARQAKKAGIPVLYYVSPQVWAWRQGRVRKIAQVVDQLAVIFPFEPDYYRGLDLDVRYVGNPLLDEFHVERDRPAFLQHHGLDPLRPVVGLFPGSRGNEIRYILDTILEAAELLAQKSPSVQFLLPVAPTLDAAKLRLRIAMRNLPVLLVQDNIYDVAGACDAVITVSGTVTLQIALAGTPMAIIYKMSPMTYAIGKRLIKVPHIGLANIVADRRVVREFIQDEAQPEAIAQEIGRILDDADYRQAIRQGLVEVRARMGEGGCSARVAQMASLMSRGATDKGER
jgi:lipid-A-disaccharide synthase